MSVNNILHAGVKGEQNAGNVSDDDGDSDYVAEPATLKKAK